MNRKTFFRTLALNCLRIADPAVALWDIVSGAEEETVASPPVDSLYREAMRLGIDPACMDRHQLRECIDGYRQSGARERQIQSGKEGMSRKESPC